MTKIKRRYLNNKKRESFLKRRWILEYFTRAIANAIISTTMKSFHNTKGN